jgi:hypothetical protein
MSRREPRGRGIYRKTGWYLIKELTRLALFSGHPTHLVLSASSSTITPAMSTSVGAVLAAVVAYLKGKTAYQHQQHQLVSERNVQHCIRLSVSPMSVSPIAL